MPDFDLRYGRAFEEYARDRSEAALGAAYELGRRAVASGRGVLELADAHHRALRSLLEAGVPGPDAVEAGADFFRETLAALEVALRGYTEAQETARLESEHAQRQRMLAEASLAINAELRPAAILRIASEQARRILEARNARAEMRVRREVGLGDPREPHRDVLRASISDNGNARGEPRVETPILGRGGRRLGTLVVAGSPRPEAEQQPILLQLAQMASVAIENAQRYARERRIAETLQRSLLPPSLPAIPGLEIAARFSPAGDGIQVGGDFYDVFRVSEGHWYMVIGDVCGKGPEAAALTALTRYTLRAAALYEDRPSRLLKLLNQAMLDQRDDGRFATVLCLRLTLDDEGVHVVAASAGHPLPLLLRPDGRVVAAGAGGTLLGVVPAPRIPDAEIVLGPGDTLLLYTDGVIEVREGGKEVFGAEDLAALLATCADASPREILDRIEHTVLHGSGGRPQDDVALLGLRVAGRRGDGV